MTKKQKQAIYDKASSLNNNELETLYYDTVFNSLGSQVDIMIIQGYDIRDIQERQRHERYMAEKSEILESICLDRGIKLW